MDHNEPPITPLYVQQTVNDPIVLGTLPIAFESDESLVSGTAEIVMRFNPDAHLDFQTSWPSHAQLSPLSTQKSALLLPQTGARIEGFGAGSNSFHPRKSVVDVSGPTAAINRTVFHLFNFPTFMSSSDCTLATQRSGELWSVRCGLVTLRAGGWIVRICATAKTWEDDDALREHGGWLITHVGDVVRENGASYTDKDLNDLLLCLHRYLSFALGRWTALALPVGFDAEGKRVFEQWGLPLAASGRWNGSTSWFDIHHGDLLAQVFPGFWKLWISPLWKEPLSESIYWYLGASDRRVGVGVDTGLIIAQTALELLAWNYCVRDRRMVSEQAFSPRGLSAADKFRLLASSLSIPLELPTQLKALHAKRGKKWSDAMDALTDVRNGLVHPHDHRDMPPGGYFEAWKLALWFIDLVILRLCGHSGSYVSRLQHRRCAGDVDPVPWAMPSNVV